MRVIDASAVLDIWENYPLDQFPRVWDWIENEFASGDLIIPDVALGEIGHKEPDCKALLETYGVQGVGIGNQETVQAVAMKAELGIQNDQYGSGVDENDILIIAVAQARGIELVTSENRQPVLPANMRSYKMPATCSLPGVQVDSLSLIEYIRQSGKVF